MPSLTQLQYILAVHRYGHFGRAAEACHVSQPALSTQIKKAEEELGVTVFVRDNKPVTATEKGYALIEQSQVVVSAHERLLRLAQGHFETLSGPLSLGIIPTLAPYVAPWFVSAFAEHYPEVELTIFERHTDDIVTDLRMMRLDVGLLALPLELPRFRERVLFHDPFSVYAAADEPLLDRDAIDSLELDTSRMWLLEDGHCLRNQTLGLCEVREGRSFLESVRFEAGSLETIRQLIDASGGYTLIPETFARRLPKSHRARQVRPFIAPTPVREIGLLHLRNTWKADLIEALEAVISKNIPRSLRRPPESMSRLSVI